MTLEILQKEMIKAMKDRDKERKDTLSSLVSAIKLVGINERCKDNIPEELVNKAILKELKTIQEQIDTCPGERVELLTTYNKRKEIIEEFAPRLMTKEEIKEYLEKNFSEVMASKNKGLIMKNVMPTLKGKADGKDINFVISEMLK